MIQRNRAIGRVSSNCIALKVKYVLPDRPAQSWSAGLLSPAGSLLPFRSVARTFRTKSLAQDEQKEARQDPNTGFVDLVELLPQPDFKGP